MSNFNPTHEFRGLELEHHQPAGYVYGLGHFHDESGKLYLLDPDAVTKLVPRPKPGEVWKYLGTLPHEYRLEVVTRSGDFRDLDGKLTHYEGNERFYKKVLNADGTQA